MPSTRWLHGKQFCREQRHAALNDGGKLPRCSFLFFLLFSLPLSDYVMQLSFPSQKVLFSGGWRKSLPRRSLQRIERADPLDPGFIQCRFPRQGHAHTVRPQRNVLSVVRGGPQRQPLLRGRQKPTCKLVQILLGRGLGYRATAINTRSVPG